MEEKIKEINDLNNRLKSLRKLENLLKTKQGKPLIGFRKSFFIAIEIEDWDYHEVEMPSSIRENILENLKILIDTIENQLNALLK